MRIEDANKVRGAVKSADEAQAQGTTSNQLRAIAGSIETGWLSFGAKATKQRLFAAAEILANREAIEAGVAIAPAKTAAPQDAAPQLSVKDQLLAKTEQLKQDDAALKAAAIKRDVDMKEGFPALAESPDVAAFASFVHAKHNHEAAQLKPDEVNVIPLLHYDLGPVELVNPGFSSAQLNAAFIFAQQGHLPSGRQTIVMTPHGLRQSGGTVGSNAQTKAVDLDALARAGIDIDQLRARVKSAMAEAAKDGGAHPVKVKIDDLDRLTPPGSQKPDFDALMAKVETHLGDKFPQNGAQAIIDLVKAEAPGMCAADFRTFACRLLKRIGGTTRIGGGRYGGDFKLWLYHRDLLRIGVVVGKEARKKPFEANDLAPLKSAMASYAQQSRSSSSCYEMYEPNGQVSQDKYCGFYEIWSSLQSSLTTPWQGPGWGLARDLGWDKPEGP